MRLRTRAALLVGALSMGVMLPAGALPVAMPTAADDEVIASETMSLVKNLPYEDAHDTGANQGTDVEFATITVGEEAREFAFAGSYFNGLQIVDITDPEQAEIVSVYDCGVAQGDVQVFTRDGSTYVTYTQDTGYSFVAESQCYLDAEALRHLDEGTAGTFIVDVSDPYDPQTVSFVPLAKGSHNQTVHPSGDYLYNSNSELITNVRNAAIEVIDITDLSAPEQVATLRLPQRPGLGTDSHDITFNAEGDRAYSAALSQTVIIDTTDPASPEIITSFMDPAINVEHQANPVTIDDPTLGERDFLIVEDEVAGAAGSSVCPTGGVHVYDITGELELAPLKVGYWNIDELRAVSDPTPVNGQSCTAHVFQIHEDAALMTIAFYNGGTRVVDISGLVGVALGDGGVGMREVGFLRLPDSNAWSAKTNDVGDGSDFYLYANDQDRGLDVLRFQAEGGSVATTSGTGRDAWLSPEAALAKALERPAASAGEQPRPFCLLPR